MSVGIEQDVCGGWERFERYATSRIMTEITNDDQGRYNRGIELAARVMGVSSPAFSFKDFPKHIHYQSYSKIEQTKIEGGVTVVAIGRALL